MPSSIELRRVEVALDKARDKAARELVEANKRRVEISEIKTELEGTRGGSRKRTMPTACSSKPSAAGCPSWRDG